MIQNRENLTPMERRKKIEFGCFLAFVGLIFPLLSAAFVYTTTSSLEAAALVTLSTLPILFPIGLILYFFSLRSHQTNILTFFIYLGWVAIVVQSIRFVTAVLPIYSEFDAHPGYAYITLVMGIGLLFMAMTGVLFSIWMLYRTREVNYAIQFRLGATHLYNEWKETLSSDNTVEEVDSTLSKFKEKWSPYSSAATQLANTRKEEIASIITY